MILLDTGVLIDFFRGKDKKLPPLFASHPLAVCGVVRAEIVAGHRSAKQRADEIAGLDRLHQVPTSDVLWGRLGESSRLCAQAVSLSPARTHCSPPSPSKPGWNCGRATTTSRSCKPSSRHFNCSPSRPDPTLLSALLAADKLTPNSWRIQLR